ncbi:MAG: hypothetical protein ACU83N_14615 [Gammaproteobacteria bacterium]
MDIGTFLKLAGLLLWPVILLLLYYLADKEGFRRKLEKIKRESFRK